MEENDEVKSYKANKAKSIELLKKRNYYIRVENTGNPGKYLVTYPPHNIFRNKFDSFTKKYSIEDGGVLLDEEFLELPIYLRRLAILLDIQSQCNYIYIDPSLVTFFKDGLEVETVFDVMDIEMSSSDLDKEWTIYKMLTDPESFGDEKLTENYKKLFRVFKMMKGLSL